ncbi:hypothetical protein [Massilia endophytica]|uniref:hypothetical protein n=1 Tax=Massilia endophytica TaxID=2899220 RepID=UPI001E62234C|nr:hypothetical protein [Massilia endophytica]UGQ46544.1 hypothetical protein LSQ66_22715 [Massilia endophytica]
MIMPMRFDLDEFIRKLTDAGVPQRQAEAHAAALADVLEANPVATKADLVLLKAEILAEVQQMFDALYRRINRMFAVMMLLHLITLAKLFWPA